MKLKQTTIVDDDIEHYSLLVFVGAYAPTLLSTVVRWTGSSRLCLVSPGNDQCYFGVGIVSKETGTASVGN